MSIILVSITLEPNYSYGKKREKSSAERKTEQHFVDVTKDESEIKVEYTYKRTSQFKIYNVLKDGKNTSTNYVGTKNTISSISRIRSPTKEKAYDAAYDAAYAEFLRLDNMHLSGDRIRYIIELISRTPITVSPAPKRRLGSHDESYMEIIYEVIEAP
jgi:hypothetical protein